MAQAFSGGKHLSVSSIEDEVVSGDFCGKFRNLVPGFLQAFDRLDPHGLAIRQFEEDVEFPVHDCDLHAHKLFPKRGRGTAGTTSQAICQGPHFQ